MIRCSSCCHFFIWSEIGSIIWKRTQKGGGNYEDTVEIHWGQGLLQDGADDRGADHDTERDHQLCQPA